MDRATEERLVRLAQQAAARAVRRGNPPFGAVLADGEGQPLLTAANTQRTARDPTAHAEINLIRSCARRLGRSQLDGLHVATNAEPCSMCVSALIKARVAAIHYGAPHEPHMDPPITAAELIGRSHHAVSVSGGILAEACAAQIHAAREGVDPPD
jgi:tRNA(Arg) A34 adenosine deaminase TadA